MSRTDAVATPARESAVVLVAHGAPHHPGAGTSLRRLAESLRRRRSGAIAEVAFVHGEPTLDRALAGLSNEPSVCVVPMFGAEGHHTRRVIPDTLDAARSLRPWCSLRQAPALGILPAYTRSLARRLRALVADAALDAAQAAFVAIGHGRRGTTAAPDDAASRLEAALRHDFAASQALYLDGAPAAADWPMRIDRADVVVAPVFFSDAQHAAADVPKIFGLADMRPALTDGIAGPFTCDGRRVWIAALPPASACVADIVVDLARRGERLQALTPRAGDEPSDARRA